MTLEPIQWRGFEQHGVNDAEASEAHERSLKQLVVILELGAEERAELFRDGRPRLALNQVVLAAFSDDVDREHALLNRAERVCGAVSAGRDRSSDRLAIARTRSRE